MDEDNIIEDDSELTLDKVEDDVQVSDWFNHSNCDD